MIPSVIATCSVRIKAAMTEVLTGAARTVRALAVRRASTNRVPLGPSMKPSFTALAYLPRDTNPRITSESGALVEALP